MYMLIVCRFVISCGLVVSLGVWVLVPRLVWVGSGNCFWVGVMSLFSTLHVIVVFVSY